MTDSNSKVDAIIDPGTDGSDGGGEVVIVVWWSNASHKKLSQN